MPTIVEIAIIGPRTFFSDEQTARAEKGEDPGLPTGRPGYIACIALMVEGKEHNISGGAYDKHEAAQLVLKKAVDEHGLKYDSYKLIGPVMPARVTV